MERNNIGHQKLGSQAEANYRKISPVNLFLLTFALLVWKTRCDSGVMCTSHEYEGFLQSS